MSLNKNEKGKKRILIISDFIVNLKLIYLIFFSFLDFIST